MDSISNRSEGAPRTAGPGHWVFEALRACPPHLSPQWAGVREPHHLLYGCFSRPSSRRASRASHGRGHPKPSHASDHQPLKARNKHLVAAHYENEEVCLDFLPEKSTRIQGSL